VWTGIQRVVRETTRRWLAAKPQPTLAAFDLRRGRLRPLSPSESDVITSVERSGTSGAVDSGADGQRSRDEVLIPWRCRLILPELFAEPRRCAAYRALATAGVLHSLSIICYDLVPLVASETVADGMPAAFVEYLSVVKHADRISAISRSTADGYTAYAAMSAAQGVLPPLIEAHELPTEARDVSDESLASARSRMGVDELPLVLVVGSHEPRKNHLRLLEAAERLWTAGVRFQLLFVGGSSWRSEGFDDLTARLAVLGRPVEVVRSASEEDLWTAYRIARFSVYPSLLEGFGLPVAESLAVGTPAITSGHGSMAEIAAAGGCLVVDPYDVTSIETAMSRLLGDDALLERLRIEARNRQRATWADYAEAVWDFFVSDGTA
jgi:glycosyltransferase involved in cell wall biosynthesis